MGEVNGWTNYGPLTSAFAQPSDCTSLKLISFTVSRSITQVMGTKTEIFPAPTPSPQLRQLGPLLKPSCFPPQYPIYTPQITPAPTLEASQTISESEFYTGSFFSPGRCPEGWNTAKLNHNRSPQNATLAACCPPGYKVPVRGRGKGVHARSDYTYCESHLPTSSGADYSVPITALAGETLTTIRLDDWSTIGGSGTGQYVRATGINVMWSEGDFPDIDAAESSASASASAAARSYLPSTNSGLSTGAKIGLGAGIPMGLVFVAALVFSLWHRKKRMAKERERILAGWSGFGLKVDKRGNLSPPADDGHGSHEAKGPLIVKNISEGDAPQPDVPAGQVVLSEAGVVSPPPYVQTGMSTQPSTGQRSGEETDLEYEERRLKEKKELLRARIQLAREEDALRARMRS